MKALVIYESVHHGNTKKIAEAIATVLDAKLERVGAARPSLEGYDLVGFGSGIFFGKHHRRLIDFIERLDGGQLKPAFIFSTSGSGQDRLSPRPQESPGQEGIRDSRRLHVQGPRHLRAVPPDRGHEQGQAGREGHRGARGSSRRASSASWNCA